MWFSLWFFLLPLLTRTDGGAGAEASKSTAQVKAGVPRGETHIPPPPYLHLPVFVGSNLPLVAKEHFAPARGSKQEPLPEAVRELLLPAALPGTSAPSAPHVPVKTWCWRNRMHVQVERSLLGTGEAHPQLWLGSCHTTNSTEGHLYFEYDFDQCGTTRTIINNQVAYSNTLRYVPTKLQEPIRRAVPFTLSVVCYYNRFQYSYKVGYKPKMQMRKIFKSMRNRLKYSLTPRNAQWERISPSDQYLLGMPMYFEAEAPSMSPDKRLYIRSCYVTPDKSHTSTLQFPVVKNLGCMVESKESHSRFIPYKNNVVRFTVDAFLFKGMPDQQLYMHCNMSVGSSVPSTAAKSCNYDPKAGRWVELYGSDSVCTCCDSNCRSTASPETKIISSNPWTIKPKAKPTTFPKRNRVSTTTTTTTTTTAATAAATAVATQQPETTRKVTTRKLTPQPQLEHTVKKRPFGGGGTWIEMEAEERQVMKGSAVVEGGKEEEKKKEEEEVVKKVKEPRIIFEEIFHFGE